MESWAQQQAARIKSSDQKKEDERKEAVRLHDILQDDSKLFFRKLGEHIGRHVEEFVAEMGAPILRYERADNTISVVKESHPKINLTLTYEKVPLRVNLNRVKMHVFASETANATFQFGLDRNGQICLESKDPDTIAREVLKSVFEDLHSDKMN